MLKFSKEAVSGLLPLFAQSGSSLLRPVGSSRSLHTHAHTHTHTHTHSGSTAFHTLSSDFSTKMSSFVGAALWQLSFVPSYWKLRFTVTGWLISFTPTNRDNSRIKCQFLVCSMETVKDRRKKLKSSISRLWDRHFILRSDTVSFCVRCWCNLQNPAPMKTPLF